MQGYNQLRLYDRKEIQKQTKKNNEKMNALYVFINDENTKVEKTIALYCNCIYFQQFQSFREEEKLIKKRIKEKYKDQKQYTAQRMSLQEEKITREMKKIIDNKSKSHQGQSSFCINSDNEDDSCDVMYKMRRISSNSAKSIVMNEKNLVDLSKFVKSRALKIDDDDEENHLEPAQYDNATQYSTSCSQISSSVAHSTFSGQEEQFSLSASSIYDSKLSFEQLSHTDLTLEQIITDAKSGMPSLNEEKVRQQKVLKQRISKQQNITSESVQQTQPTNSVTDSVTTFIDPKLVKERIVTRINSNAFSSRKQHTKKWSDEETLRFFKGLQVFGTDFSLIQKLFPDRTRSQIKNKFRKEEKENNNQVEESIILNSKRRFNKIQTKLTIEKQKIAIIKPEIEISERIDLLKQERKRRLNSFESVDSTDIICCYIKNLKSQK